MLKQSTQSIKNNYTCQAKEINQLSSNLTANLSQRQNMDNIEMICT